MRNVADVISKVIDQPEMFEGRTIDCFGPQDYTYKELAAFVYDITGQEPLQVDMPKNWMKTMAKFYDKQSNPFLTQDSVDLLSADFTAPLSSDEYVAEAEKASGVLTMADFDITPTPVEKVSFEYLHRFRAGGHFVMVEGYHSNVK